MDSDNNREMENLEETASIQKAIEKIADDETTNLSGLISSQEENMIAEEPEATAPENVLPEPADAPVHRWFFTFMCMNLPVIGWIYLLFLAFSKRDASRRNFARAYLFYKLVFLLISALIVGILIYIGLDLLDQLLAYMEML